MAIYTTEESIARKLIGRLNIDPTVTTLPLQSVAGFGQSVTGQTVQPELLTDIIEEKESYVSLVLAQMYQVPLRLTSSVTVNTIKSIVDGLVISKLLQIHYESSVSPISGSQDMGNASSDMRRQAELQLAAISGSSNVFTGVQPSPQNRNYGQREIQTLVLPEEIVLSRGEKPDITTRNYSISSLGDTSKRDADRKALEFTHTDDRGCCGGRGYFSWDRY